MVDSFLSIHKPNGLIPQIGDNDSARLHKISSFKETNELDHSHIFAVGAKYSKIKNLNPWVRNSRLNQTLLPAISMKKIIFLRIIKIQIVDFLKILALVFLKIRRHGFQLLVVLTGKIN